MGSTLEYCNSIDSINSTYSSYSIGSTVTSTTNNNNTNNINSNNNSTLNNLNNGNPSTNNNSSTQKISDSASISSLSNAASYLIGSRRFSDKRKRSSKSISNGKDNSGMDKDTSQSLDETSMVPFFFYDWKISISYYMIKVDPEVIIVLIYECQNKDPAIIDFLTKLVACLRNVTLFEQLKVDWWKKNLFIIYKYSNNNNKEEMKTNLY